MLTSKDLMIGDWINTSLGISKVVCLDDGIMFKGYDKNGLNVVFRDGGITLKPIPLTAEILEKNGFTRFGTEYILKERHFGLDNPSTPSNYLDDYWIRVSIKAVHIESVHELQHALRLCGIEKEIEL